MIVEDRQGDVGQQRREDAALGRAGVGVPLDAILTEDASFQERLHQSQDAPVPDAMSHPTHESRVVDLVEAGRDVRLEHPLV